MNSAIEKNLKRAEEIQRRLPEAIQVMSAVDRSLAGDLVWLAGEFPAVLRQFAEAQEALDVRKNWSESVQQESKKLRQQIGSQAHELGELRARQATLDFEIARAKDKEWKAVEIAQQLRRRLFRLEMAYGVLRDTLDRAGVCIFKSQAKAAVDQADRVYAPPVQRRHADGVADA
jgi:chromosome segregation ATPase